MITILQNITLVDALYMLGSTCFFVGTLLSVLSR
jgi:hypothetical protein